MSAASISSAGVSSCGPPGVTDAGQHQRAAGLGQVVGAHARPASAPAPRGRARTTRDPAPARPTPGRCQWSISAALKSPDDRQDHVVRREAIPVVLVRLVHVELEDRLLRPDHRAPVGVDLVRHLAPGLVDELVGLLAARASSPAARRASRPRTTAPRTARSSSASRNTPSASRKFSLGHLETEVDLVVPGPAAGLPPEEAHLLAELRGLEVRRAALEDEVLDVVERALVVLVLGAAAGRHEAARARRPGAHPRAREGR